MAGEQNESLTARNKESSDKSNQFQHPQTCLQNEKNTENKILSSSLNKTKSRSTLKTLNY